MKLKCLMELEEVDRAEIFGDYMVSSKLIELAVRRIYPKIRVKESEPTADVAMQRQPSIRNEEAHLDPESYEGAANNFSPREDTGANEEGTCTSRDSETLRDLKPQWYPRLMRPKNARARFLSRWTCSLFPRRPTSFAVGTRCSALSASHSTKLLRTTKMPSACSSTSLHLGDEWEENRVPIVDHDRRK